MKARLRKKAYGLIAIGVRSRKYRAKFEWVIGTPTVRAIKGGLKWAIRTSKRLVDKGFKHELDLAVVEGAYDLKNMTKEELNECFLRAVHKFMRMKHEEGFEVEWFKVLLYSKLALILRGKLKPKSETCEKQQTLPVYAKRGELLYEVTLCNKGRGMHIKLKPLNLIKIGEGKGAGSRKEATIKKGVNELKGKSLKKTLKILRQLLEAHGFTMLKYKTSSRRKTKTEQMPRGWIKTPWDFSIFAKGLIRASSEEKLKKLMVPLLLEAPIQVRGFIMECMLEMWRKLHWRYDPAIGRPVDKITFNELRKWLMPYGRCDNIDTFDDAFRSLMRCFELDETVMDRQTYIKARYWWLYQDALHYVKKLLGI